MRGRRTRSRQSRVVRALRSRTTNFWRWLRPKPAAPRSPSSPGLAASGRQGQGSRGMLSASRGRHDGAGLSSPSRDRTVRRPMEVEPEPGSAWAPSPEPAPVQAAAAFAAAASVLGPRAPSPARSAAELESESQAHAVVGAPADARHLQSPRVSSEEDEWRRQLRAQITQTLHTEKTPWRGQGHGGFAPGPCGLAGSLPDWRWGNHSGSGITHLPGEDESTAASSQREPLCACTGDKVTSCSLTDGHAASPASVDATVSVVGAEVIMQGVRMELCMDGAATGHVAAFDPDTGQCKVLLEAFGSLRAVAACSPRLPSASCSVAGQEAPQVVAGEPSLRSMSRAPADVAPGAGPSGAPGPGVATGVAVLKQPRAVHLPQALLPGVPLSLMGDGSEDSSSDDESLDEARTPTKMVVPAQ